MPNEVDPIRKYGGRYGHEIDKADEELRRDIRENTRRLADLEKAIFANGRPSLEDRMKAYTDSRVEHKERNLRQDDADLLVEIKENRKRVDEAEDRQKKRSDEIQRKQDERHEENQKRFNSLENKMAMAAGAIIVLQPLFALLLQHMFGKN